MIKRNQSSLGIDLSDKTANFCSMTAEDGVLAEGKIRLTPPGVAELWKQHGSVDVIVIEAGTPSAWVRELLTSLGARVIVADPRKLKAVTDSVRKSDERDARMLARVGLADESLLSPTYERPLEFRRVMALLKVRDQQVRARTMTVLEIRSQVKLVGARMPRCDASDFHDHEDAVPAELREVLAPLFETLRAIARAIGALDLQIERAGEGYPVVARLAKIDGVGPITALAFVAVVCEPARFARTRDIGAYFGLVPRRSQSGESDPSRHISKAGCGFMRRLLLQCAHCICRPLGKDTALRRRALRELGLRGKAGKRQVLVALARKLAVLMLSLWKSGESWIPLHRVAATPAVDAPQPVVPDECEPGLCPPEGALESAPSSMTRTHACTGGDAPTKSADGSTGHSGATTTRQQATTPRVQPVARASAPARPATPSAPTAPACAGDPADLASASRAKPRGKRGRFAAEGVSPST